MSLSSSEKENETRKSALKMSFGGGAAECVTYILMCQDGVLMIKNSSFLISFNKLLSVRIPFLSCFTTGKEPGHTTI